ncbi:MAG TPA: ABC transporter permease [Gemmatimonadaceae bacterium]|nr:ABC transporter permease [Gemmatimonadaceae bacterium]
MNAHGGDRSLLTRAYAAGLGLYPRAFRDRFGDALEAAVIDRVRAARRSAGASGAALAWANVFIDLALTAAAERGSQVASGARRAAMLAGEVIHPETTPGSRNAMNAFLQDLRYALRGILARPGFSAVIIGTLALGIGANTAIFSVVEGVLLRALPYAQPGGIVHISHKGDFGSVSEGEFVDYRSGTRSLSKLAAFSFAEGNLTGDRDPERLRFARVSEDFFSILGATPVHGRTFSADENRRGGPRVTVISHGLWLRQFGGDSSIVGKTIRVNGGAFTVIGVMPRHFDYPDAEVAAWLPMRLNYDTLWSRNNHYLQLVGRLALGATPGVAATELMGMAKPWPQQFPEIYKPNSPPIVTIEPISDAVLGRTKPYLVALLGAVGFVLVIACVNVANLLLARTESRRRELAIRTALGATRGRIVRQVLTESALYAAGGAALGLPLAWWGWRALISLAPATIPRLDLVSLNVPVLLFTLITASLTGFLFGIVPAFRAARGDAGETLKSAGKTSGQGFGLRRARSALVVAEVALAVVTLTGAGLMPRSLARLQSIDLGIKPEHVLSVQVAATPARYHGEAAVAFYDNLLSRVRAVPGVQAAGAIADLPIADDHSDYSILLDGAPMTSVANAPVATPEQVTPGYFETLGIPIVAGRAFTEDDRASADKVVIVNEAMVRKYWPHTNPIGHTVKMLNEKSAWATVVGVARDVRHGGYLADPPPTTYFPYAQSDQTVYNAPSRMSLVVRGTGDASLLTAPVRAIMHDLDPAVPLARVQSMESLVSASVASRRFSTQLLALFALLAVVLAAIGIYGVVSYSVSQRTFEIGLRMALGAESAAVLKLVLREGIALAFVGLAIGGAVAIVIMGFARSLLVQVSIADPVTLAAVALLLTATAGFASYLPARRAMRLEPTRALRSE